MQSMEDFIHRLETLIKLYSDIDQFKKIEKK